MSSLLRRYYWYSPPGRTQKVKSSKQCVFRFKSRLCLNIFTHDFCKIWRSHSIEEMKRLFHEEERAAITWWKEAWCFHDLVKYGAIARINSKYICRIKWDQLKSLSWILHIVTYSSTFGPIFPLESTHFIITLKRLLFIYTNVLIKVWMNVESLFRILILNMQSLQELIMRLCVNVESRVSEGKSHMSTLLRLTRDVFLYI